MASPLVLLENADLYSPEPLGIGHVLVAGERIAWIGHERLVLPAALAVERVDAEGARVIPGLIDGHVHLTGGGGEAGYDSRVPPPPLTAYTLGGVTTAIGVLGTDDVTRTTGELVATARGLVAQGLSAWCHTGGYHVPPVTLTGSVRGDLVHVDRIIGVGEVAIADHRSSQPTFDELVRLGADAHVAGLMTGKAGLVHLHVGDGARGLEFVRRARHETDLPARTWQPTHVNRHRALFDEALDVARDGVPVDITDFPVADGEDAWSAADALVRYLESDAPPHLVTVSSDGGGCLPVFDAEGRVVRYGVGTSRALAETLATLLARGWPLAHVLPAFTENVADTLRLPAKGRLEVGMDADLVRLDAAGRPRDVMARGAWHVRDGIPVRRGTFEP
jgi:beta-aspartyl-dipeptidase (metallo-type)